MQPSAPHQSSQQDRSPPPLVLALQLEPHIQPHELELRIIPTQPEPNIVADELEGQLLHTQAHTEVQCAHCAKALPSIDRHLHQHSIPTPVHMTRIPPIQVSALLYVLSDQGPGDDCPVVSGGSVVI